MIALYKAQLRASMMTPTILSQLGVEYKHGRGFWQRNRDRLEWIAADFEVAAKRIERAAHPNGPGGDAERFIELRKTIDMVRRQFRAHGVGRKPEDAVARSCVADSNRIARQAYNLAYQRRKQMEKRETSNVQRSTSNVQLQRAA